MSQFDKLLMKLLRGGSDASFAFSDLRYILVHLGFAERTHGSHHTFRKPGLEDKVTLVYGKEAKPYQVRWVRDLILKHKLGGYE
jgi:predicted RNA binding protein YcfA (HicA-like mRNA interferase family)